MRGVETSSFLPSLHQPWVCSGPGKYRFVSLFSQLGFVLEDHLT